MAGTGGADRVDVWGTAAGLNVDSISSNGMANQLSGQGGRDLFFEYFGRDAVDLEAGEIFYDI